MTEWTEEEQSQIESAREQLGRIVDHAATIAAIAREMEPASWRNVTDELHRAAEQLADIRALFDPDGELDQ